MSVLGTCLVGEVAGVKLEMHQTKECSDAPTTLIIASDSCFMKGLQISCKGDDVTFKKFEPAATAGAGCKAGTEIGTITFKSGDGKCHAPESAASSVALAGVAVAALVASLALLV